MSNCKNVHKMFLSNVNFRVLEMFLQFLFVFLHFTGTNFLLNALIVYSANNTSSPPFSTVTNLLVGYFLTVSAKLLVF